MLKQMAFETLEKLFPIPIKIFLLVFVQNSYIRISILFFKKEKNTILLKLMPQYITNL